MDNFVEIEIKQKKLFRTVTKKRGLLFDMYAWFLLWQELGWDFTETGRKTMDELQVGMLYTGALSWHRHNGIKVDFTKEDITKWMDEIPNGKMKEIGRVLLESMKVLEEMKTAGESKKN